VPVLAAPGLDVEQGLQVLDANLVGRGDFALPSHEMEPLAGGVEIAREALGDAAVLEMGNELRSAADG
jgi:hypothetical protein